MPASENGVSLSSTNLVVGSSEPLNAEVAELVEEGRVKGQPVGLQLCEELSSQFETHPRVGGVLVEKFGEPGGHGGHSNPWGWEGTMRILKATMQEE